MFSGAWIRMLYDALYMCFGSCQKFKVCSLLLYLTSSMQRSPWETDSSSSSQERPHILWKPNILHHVHTSPEFYPILNLTKPFLAQPSCFFKIHFNIVLFLKCFSAKCLLSVVVPCQNPVSISRLLHTYQITLNEKYLYCSNNLSESSWCEAFGKTL